MTLSHVRYVVLDEADRMLDIGFRADIERILKRCPTERQTLLMSATVPDSIKRLVNRYMCDPIHLHMTPNTPTVDKIRQSYFTVDPDRKFELLKRVIEREKPRQCLIFVERKRWADNLYRDLKRHGSAGRGDPRRPAAVAAREDHGGVPHRRDQVPDRDRRDEPRHRRGRICRTSSTSTCRWTSRTTSTGSAAPGASARTGSRSRSSAPEQGGLLTDIEMMINRLIEADQIEGFEAAAPRAKRPPAEARVVFSGLDALKPAPKPEGEDDGWESDDAPPATPPDAGGGTGEAAKKPVFGKRSKRYSQRL